VKTHLALKQSMDALQRTSAELARAKQRMELELNVGRDIQQSMLPSTVPERTEVTLYASMDAAREVGGDFYDYYMQSGNELCFCVADVSGKGVPAALFMAMSKILIRSRARDEKGPAEIIARVNAELSEDNPECMFVTVFFGVLNLSTGELVYTNGGHNPPLIRRACGAVEVLSDIHGPVVAVMPGEEYGQSTLQMEPGDVLLVFTDGVTEAMDTNDKLYGDDRLFDVLKAVPESNARSLVDGVNESVAAFAAGAEQADDITMLAVQYNG
jgi:sigma-B regulation protein RsbU (phosphoserine phosphatase)